MSRHPEYCQTSDLLAMQEVAKKSAQDSNFNIHQSSLVFRRDYSLSVIEYTLFKLPKNCEEKIFKRNCYFDRIKLSSNEAKTQIAEKLAENKQRREKRLKPQLNILLKNETSERAKITEQHRVLITKLKSNLELLLKNLDEKKSLPIVEDKTRLQLEKKINLELKKYLLSYCLEAETSVRIMLTNSMLNEICTLVLRSRSEADALFCAQLEKIAKQEPTQVRVFDYLRYIRGGYQSLSIEFLPEMKKVIRDFEKFYDKDFHKLKENLRASFFNEFSAIQVICNALAAIAEKKPDVLMDLFLLFNAVVRVREDFGIITDANKRSILSGIDFTPLLNLLSAPILKIYIFPFTHNMLKHPTQSYFALYVDAYYTYTWIQQIYKTTQRQLSPRLANELAVKKRLITQCYDFFLSHACEIRWDAHGDLLAKLLVFQFGLISLSDPQDKELSSILHPVMDEIFKSDRLYPLGRGTLYLSTLFVPLEERAGMNQQSEYKAEALQHSQ